MIVFTVLLLMRIKKLSYAAYGAAELLYRLTGV